MKCYKFVACVYLLSDVLPHLSRLSRIFQREDVDLSLIQPCLKTTIDSIKEYVHSPGPNLSKIDHVLATDLKDFQIVATDSQKEAFKSSIQAVYIQAIVDQLHNRFPHVELLDAFSIFDPHTLPFDEKDVATHENGEPTAHGLFKFMKCYKFVACVYLLSDVLPHLSRLSRIF